MQVKITEIGLGKIIETEVLILGAGAAGSGAAIAARREADGSSFACNK